MIYEMHVRGFTQDPSSHVKYPGTFLGVIEKIPHLLEMGVSSVELMPIFPFDHTRNFWGYDPIDFFTPTSWYAVENSASEFKELVNALHSSGIKVILDVVYNHSSIFSHEPESYYLLENGKHTNYSGCGNTLGANLPKMRQLILDSLYHFVNEFNVDGFRFDLAATLTRGGDETIQQITKEFKGLQLIAEPWDPGGLYLLGQFPEGWYEWSDVFRDGVRRHVNFGDPMTTKDLAKRPINYVVSHDGFTVMDLVSYKEKHNAANKENNQDGCVQNYSDNCGVEGPTDDPTICAERKKRMQKMLELNFAQEGTPMLFMGTEYAHSRQGNNNAWCQDNRLNWFLWDELEKNQSWFDIVKKCIFSSNTGGENA